MISFSDALDDPELFASHFNDPATWTAWRAWGKAAFGEPLTDEEHQVFNECTGRDEPAAGGYDEVWTLCGRRGGKSLFMALTGIYLSVARDYRPYLALGERATLPIIAATRPQARNIFRYVRGALQSVPMLRKLVESETAESIDLRNSVTIEVATASYKSMRGYTLLSAVCDEICFWASDEYSRNPDTEILAAIRPGMGSIPGAKLLCASSPHAKRGEAYENYKRYFGQDGSNILVWQAGTRRMNPTFKQSIIDREMEKDAAKAASEYLGQWREDISSFISRDVVESAVDRGVRERPYQQGRKYHAFCDPSGGSSDSFSLCIGHIERDNMVIVDCVREIGAPFVPTDAIKELAGVLKSYRLYSVTGDKYAGQWVLDAFSKEGIVYNYSKSTRSELYMETLPLLNSGRVRLLDNPKTVNQLCALERRTARSGKDSIDHSPGAHDDSANAAAGCITMVTESAKPGSGSEPLDVFFSRMNSENYRYDPVTGRMRFQIPTVPTPWRT